MAETPETVTVVDPDEWPDLTARDAKEYLDQQVPYPNHATNRELAQRALTLYRQAKNQCEEDTRDVRENWRWIDWLFRANSLRRLTNRDVHVPELLKHHRALVPRVVEAFFGNGSSFFFVRGRDRVDRQRDAAVTALLEFQLHQNRFSTLMAPYVSSLCKYQVAVWKVTWEVKTRKVPYHWITHEQKPNGEVVELHHRKMQDVAHFVGNRIRLVDPARFIVDAERWDLDDLSYAGDTRMVPLHEVMEDDRFVNRDQVLEFAHSGSAVESRVAPSTTARSGIRRTQTNGDDTPKNTTNWVEQGELWCWFNWARPNQKPDMRETVITVIDNKTVVRLQENFHDDKHLPYAIARYSDNGIEFFGVGLYDPALRVQEEIDHSRGSIYEAFDLINAPRAFAKGNNLDLPNSMYDMPPGYIGKGVDGITFAPIPSTLRDAPFIDAIQRRDMEEITGVTRTWLGSSASGLDQDETATAFRGKMQESNRRLLGLVRNIDEGSTALLRIMHANNQQFMADKTKFRILSPKLAKLLNANEYVMKPSELLGEVDFSFYGVMRIQQYGLRGTNLMTYLQVMAPLIQENPEQFDVPALSRQVYEATVGEEMEDDIMREGADFTGMSDQKAENIKLRFGHRVAVHPLDDDAAHLRDMDEDGMREFVANKDINEAVRRPAWEHYTQHIEQRDRKRAEMAAMQQMAERRRAMRGDDDQGGGNGDQAPPAGGLERGKRQTNGDGTPQQVGKAGRRGAVTQGNNG